MTDVLTVIEKKFAVKLQMQHNHTTWNWMTPYNN